MIYITGDTHGDMNRIVRFCERMETSQEDIMIILGDVGLNYYGDSRDRRNKEKVANLPITLFCIHGNHERTQLYDVISSRYERTSFSEERIKALYEMGIISGGLKIEGNTLKVAPLEKAQVLELTDR